MSNLSKVSSFADVMVDVSVELQLCGLWQGRDHFDWREQCGNSADVRLF
jgi:hypothetical protein